MSNVDSDSLSAQEAEAFRLQVREFLAKNAIGNMRDGNSVGVGREFQKKLADAGLAGLTYAKEIGRAHV